MSGVTTKVMEPIEVHYPIGHRVRREESIPVLEAKFAGAIADTFATAQCETIVAAFGSDDFESQSVESFMQLFVRETAETGTMLA